MFQTEFEFTLPKGYLDESSILHRRGIMRLSKAVDEIAPLRDPRVRANPAYATVIILSRVITKLGALEEVTPVIIEGLFSCDLNYLHRFYRQINELEENDLEKNQEPESKSEPELESLDLQSATYPPMRVQ